MPRWRLEPRVSVQGGETLRTETDVLPWTSLRTSGASSVDADVALWHFTHTSQFKSQSGREKLVAS